MAMQLPEYFLADLADAAVHTPEIIEQACLSLKNNRRQFLAERDTASVIATESPKSSVEVCVGATEAGGL